MGAVPQFIAAERETDQPRHFGLANARTVRVESLEASGPAARAGLEQGDLIVTFDGAAVEGIDSPHRLLTLERIGRPVAIGVVRGTRKLELETAPSEVSKDGAVR